VEVAAVEAGPACGAAVVVVPNVDGLAGWDGLVGWDG
jgi:hypothetical protein